MLEEVGIHCDIAKMLRLLLPVLVVVVAGQYNDPVSKQLGTYFKNNTGPVKTLTTASGWPVEYNEAYNWINEDPLKNEHLMDTYTQIVRKNIPERVVHAGGAGAIGYFNVTHDVSHIIGSKFLEKIGKTSPVICRFSLGFSSAGASDTLRESRGHACKIYTEEGNWDLTLLNQEIFAIKEPTLFPSFARVLKKNPSTNLIDYNMMWDFVSHRPETMNQLLRILSNRGMPKSYRHMRGFGIHTNQVYNASGCSSYVRFNMLPDAGEKYFNLKEAQALAAKTDYYARDLYNEIAKGNYPSYTINMQIVPEEEVLNPEMGICDVTRLLPTDKYPNHPIGKIVLNRNPDNYFAQVEQVTYAPGNLVPGILGGLDKIHQMRRFAYREAGNHRVGPNSKNIKVNQPLCPANTYNRDGMPPIGNNGGAGPSYYPNSFGGPEAYVDKNKPKALEITTLPEANNGDQVVNFVSKTLTAKEREELIEVIVENLCYCEKVVQNRSVKVLTDIYPDFGKKVLAALKKGKCIN